MRRLFPKGLSQPLQCTKKNFLIFSLLLAITWLSTGCNLTESDAHTADRYDPKFITPESTQQVQYRFAVHPLHNPTRLHEVFGPLIKHLNQHVSGVSFSLEASRDYPSFDQKLKNQSVDFALPNPYQTVEALNYHYRVFAKMGDDEKFRGIILIRKDSDIQTPQDLINHKISYPAPTALAATMMPQYFLYQQGVEIQDIENHYVGSQESSIMNVYYQLTDAAATWPPPWEALIKQRPEIQDKLKIAWQTDPLPNNGLIAHARIPDEITAQVRELLLNLHLHQKGQAILETMHLSRFEAANNQTYQPVKEFIERFSHSVRLPAEPE